VNVGVLQVVGRVEGECVGVGVSGLVEFDFDSTLEPSPTYADNPTGTSCRCTAQCSLRLLVYGFKADMIDYRS